MRDPTRERYREDAPFVDSLRQLLEACRGNQLIHLGLGPSSHHPGRTRSMTRQHAADEFELRVPRLPCVNEITALRDRVGEGFERTAHEVVVRVELVQS